jgi:phage recombination protein Bet
MSTALATLTSKLAARLDMGGDGSELLSTLKATAFKGEVSDAQMSALLIVANQYGLNPWTKEIYAFPDKKNGIIPVVGVDGWARIINNHPQFDGMDFRQSEGMVRMPEAKSDAPEWIECVMYRKDRSRPIVVREYLDETYREPFKGQYGVVAGPWQTHPKRFLRHKTMIQCARLAFGYGGIYDQDEAERITETAEPAVQPARHMGQADEVQPIGVTPELIARAEAEAAKGLANYRAFYKDRTSKAERKALQESEADYERLIEMAKAADAARTVDTAPAFPPKHEPEQPAGKSFEEIMQMLCQAKTEEALFVAADWIAGDDQEQVKLLDAKFQERLAQIRGEA